MPTAADPIADERFEELVAQLRASRPVAGEALRGRVRASAAAAPARRRRRPSARVLVPALAVALVASGAVVTARTLGPGVGGGGDEAVAEEAAGRARAALTRSGEAYSAASADSEAVRAAPAPTEPFAPAPAGRLQEQRIELGVRVRDVDALSEATAQAMGIARGLGGYVVAAHYAVPSADRGDSTLVVRVPVGRVQEAIARFTGLGTILSQDVRLQDLQPAFDRRERELRGLRERIARLERQLASEGPTDEERTRLRQQLAAARRGVETREAQQRATEQRGSLARVALTLTTEGPPAVEEEPGELEAVLGGAARLLQQILVWLLAGLIVASPFLALAFLGALALRARRRALEARLLERA